MRNLKGKLGESLPQATRVEYGRWYKGVWEFQVLVGRQHAIQSLGRHFRGNNACRQIDRDFFSKSGDKWLVIVAIEVEANWLVPFDFTTVAEEKHEEHVELEGEDPDIAGRQTNDDRHEKKFNDLNESSCRELGYEPP